MMRREHGLVERLYVLDADKVPVASCDMDAWMRWFETHHREWMVAFDSAQEPLWVSVLTKFVGIDLRPSGDGPPILWETLVIGGPFNAETQRYTALDDALAGHQATWKRVTSRVAAAEG